MSRVFTPQSGVSWEYGRIAISQEMLEEAQAYQREMVELANDMMYGKRLGPGWWEMRYATRGRRALEGLKGRPAGVLHRSLR